MPSSDDRQIQFSRLNGIANRENNRIHREFCLQLFRHNMTQERLIRGRARVMSHSITDQLDLTEHNQMYIISVRGDLLWYDNISFYFWILIGAFLMEKVDTKRVLWSVYSSGFYNESHYTNLKQFIIRVLWNIKLPIRRPQLIMKLFHFFSKFDKIFRKPYRSPVIWIWKKAAKSPRFYTLSATM